MGMPPHRQAMYADASISQASYNRHPDPRSGACANFSPLTMICTALYAPFALAPWGTLLAAHVDLSRFSAGWITLSLVLTPWPPSPSLVAGTGGTSGASAGAEDAHQCRMQRAAGRLICGLHL